MCCLTGIYEEESCKDGNTWRNLKNLTLHADILCKIAYAGAHPWPEHETVICLSVFYVRIMEQTGMESNHAPGLRQAPGERDSEPEPWRPDQEDNFY